MRLFDHFNPTTPCPICGTKDDKPAVLILIHGTRCGNICEGMQVHFECLEPVAYPSDNQIAFVMLIDRKEVANGPHP